MSQSITLPKRRIGRGTGATMVAVALALDFAVLIMLVAGLVFAFSFLSMESCGRVAADYSAGKADSTGVWGAAKGVANVDTVSTVKCAWNAAWGAGVIGGAVLTFPLMAAMVSAIAGIISVLLFTLWFAVLRVNVMGLNYRRVMVNLTTAIIESIPILNLFPMQTIGVLLHIYIANKEDDHKIKAAKIKIHAQETSNAYMQDRTARTPSQTSVSRQLESEGVFAA